MLRRARGNNRNFDMGGVWDKAGRPADIKSANVGVVGILIVKKHAGILTSCVLPFLCSTRQGYTSRNFVLPSHRYSSSPSLVNATDSSSIKRTVWPPHSAISLRVFSSSA